MSEEIPIVIVPDPSNPVFPSQKNVDWVIEGIYGLPTPADFYEYIDKGKEEFERYLQAKIDELVEKIKKMMDSFVEQIEAKAEPIMKLIKPIIEGLPTNLNEFISFVAEYIMAMAEFYAKPYKDLVDIVKFYTDFFTAIVTGLATKAGELAQPLPDGLGTLNLKLDGMNIPMPPLPALPPLPAEIPAVPSFPSIPGV